MKSRNLHSIVAILGIIFTVLGTLLVNDFVKTIALERFSTRSDSYYSVIKDGFLEHLYLVYAVGGLFDASTSVEEVEFGIFVKKLLSYSDTIEMIQWIPASAREKGSLANLTGLFSVYSVSRISKKTDSQLKDELNILKAIPDKLEQASVNGNTISFIHNEKTNDGKNRFEFDVTL